MIKRLVVLFAVLAVAIASAKTYNFTLFQPSMVAGNELKAGQYRLELKDSNVVIRSGKFSVQAPVKVESAPKKNNTTAVRYANENGKFIVQEIQLGGTTTKLVFNP